VAIVARKLEFRELLAGEFALYAIGPDGRQWGVFQHPYNAVGLEVVRYYVTVAPAAYPGVSAEMIAADLRAFRPSLFHGEQPVAIQEVTAVQS
jgi:hypothetical protein